MRISSIGLVAVVALGLGGCAYNGLGVGVGNGYGYDDYGYGYDRYGYGGGYGNYGGYGGYNPYGYGGYGSPSGWYNGYYYPGTGGWVYDRDGRRREIRRDEQAHFGRLGESFRNAVKQRSNAVTSSPDGSITTINRVRQQSRTRVIERSQRTERPSTTERPTTGADKIIRVLRDKKDD